MNTGGIPPADFLVDRGGTKEVITAIQRICENGLSSCSHLSLLMLTSTRGSGVDPGLG